MTERARTRRPTWRGLLRMASASAAAFAVVLALLVAQMRLGRDPSLGAWPMAPARSQPALGAGRQATGGGHALRTGSSATGLGSQSVSAARRTRARTPARGRASSPPLRTASSALAPTGEPRDD